MLRRYLNPLVLSNDHYYHETPLLAAMKNNSSIRKVYTSRSSTELIGAANTLFITPKLFHWEDDELSFEKVRELIESIRDEHPEVVIVLCSNLTTIQAFLATTGNRFTHYFQLDQDATDAALGQRLAEVVNACQVELDNNIRSRWRYDVALSFAGEQREFAEQIALRLRDNGALVFYDDFELSDLWGRDLYTHLHGIYSSEAHYCILLASAAYASKVWTNHERQAAQERALREKGVPYILPIRFDDSAIPGLSANIASLKREAGPIRICDVILEKMGVAEVPRLKALQGCGNQSPAPSAEKVRHPPKGRRAPQPTARVGLRSSGAPDAGTYSASHPDRRQ